MKEFKRYYEKLLSCYGGLFSLEKHVLVNGQKALLGVLGEESSKHGDKFNLIFFDETPEVGEILAIAKKKF